jgi:hypothetical protein
MYRLLSIAGFSHDLYARLSTYHHLDTLTYHCMIIYNQETSLFHPCQSP